MAGGSISAANKIAGGNAANAGATRVALAPGLARGNFAAQLATSTRRPDDRAGMAENCRFFRLRGSCVARFASHGDVKALRDQWLALQRRLIAGYAAGPSPRGRRVEPRGAGSPFARSAGATRVASESRQIHAIQVQAAPDQCPKLRSGQARSFGINGSGPEAVRSTPKNGVGGRGARSTRENGSARREGDAEARASGGVEHVARAPFVSEAAKATPRGAPVNEPVQTSVDNAK